MTGSLAQRAYELEVARLRGACSSDPRGAIRLRFHAPSDFRHHLVDRHHDQVRQATKPLCVELAQRVGEVRWRSFLDRIARDVVTEVVRLVEPTEELLARLL